MKFTNYVKRRVESVVNEWAVFFAELGKEQRNWGEILRRAKDENIPGFMSREDIEKELAIGFTETAFARYALPTAQTILFSGEQADVFKSVSQEYCDTLDFRTPFESVFLQFDRPIKIDMDKPEEVIAILIHQSVATEVADSSISRLWDSLRKFGLRNVAETGRLFSKILIIYGDYTWRALTWAGDDEQAFEIATAQSQSIASGWATAKNIVIACIGYINCENVHLQRMGDVPEAVNAKRERKGKARLEPYYICRIRGVDYESTNEKGKGMSHGHRYDVRGHFRRLTTGKVTWVRPHQRGLDNELYIPKVYSVDPPSP